jgi:hypothetical protein
MARLSKQARANLPADKFAGKDRSFPVNDRKHARAALIDINSAPPGERGRIRRMADAELHHTDEGERGTRTLGSHSKQ